MSQTEITKCEKMDRETFYQYILDNFTLSGGEQRMVDTILQFIESHFMLLYYRTYAIISMYYFY